jgi:hypothetical protein
MSDEVPLSAQPDQLLIAMADNMHRVYYGPDAAPWEELEEKERLRWLMVAHLVEESVTRVAQQRAVGVDVELIAAALLDPLVGQIVRGILARRGIRMTLLAVDNHPEAKPPPIQ